MRVSHSISNERGIALILTLFLSIIVASLAIGVIMMTSNASLISRFHAKEAMMEAAADAGLEAGRDTLNGVGITLPLAGFLTLENGVAVRDASNNPIAGFTRSTYAGRSGITSGQFGVYASLISIIQDVRGAVVVRRVQLRQESFAKFARFDDQTTSSTVFASGIQVFGPLHTNQTLYVGGGATFWGPVTTAATINTPSGSTFKQGYKESVPVIPMPTPASLATLSTYATTGNTTITGGAVGTTVYNTSTRIEFVNLDLDADGDFTDDDEGFFRVYQANGGPPTAAALNYVTAREWNTASANDPNGSSPNCGAFVGAGGIFRSAMDTNPAGANLAAARNLLSHATRRCFLGGDPRLTAGVFQVNTPAPANYGRWLKWPGYGAGTAPVRIAAGVMPASFGGGVVGATMADYLWPINRQYNPNFKGVIYVNGSVAVSGRLRGQVTVATTGNIMLADDLTYETAAGSSPDCSADIFGLLTPQFYMIEDNNVNSPFMVNGAYKTGYDESADESFNGAVLTLNSISSEDVGNGPNVTETCVGSPIGRGCYNHNGSAIQGINAPRMSSSGGGATGWNPQWTYDRCMAIAPPPYYPTTGHYAKDMYFEIDPVGFNVANWYAANQ